MEITDLTGLSKPLTRLIEVVSSGVGAVTRPYLIRKAADAKAHEIRVIADALKDVADKHKLPVVFADGAVEVWQRPEDRTLEIENRSIEYRMDSRTEYQERKRQANIEAVTATAAAELAHENAVPNEAPEEDWVTRFFQAAQDVSSEEMRQLWGRILSGEIKKPGSFSMKTLDFVRNMTKADAEVFEHIAKFALSYQGSAIVATMDKSWLEDNRQVYAGHHFALGELGLMYPTDLQYRFFVDESNSQAAFVSGKQLLLVDRTNHEGQVQLPVWKFTSVGKELLTLVRSDGDVEYLERVAQHFIKKRCRAAIASILEHAPDGRIRYAAKRDVLPEDASAAS